MTLVSSIITDAFRESNMIALGKTPNTNQSTEALRLFNALLEAAYGGDAGEMLQDWPLGSFGEDDPATEPASVYDFCEHHPGLNRRLLALNLAPITVFLASQPQDGARMAIVDPFARLAVVPVTLDGNGRAIDGAAKVTPTAAAEWFYRADLGAWKRITGVALTDDMPFPARFDAMFVILLAMRLNPRYGRTLDQQSLLVLKQGKQEFVARYLQSARLETDDSISWPFLSTQSYNNGRSFSSTSGFNQGRVRP